MTYIVYRVADPDGFVYWGATASILRDRMSRHKYDCKMGSQSLFHKSMRKHGFEKMISEVVYQVESWEQAANHEINEIQKARNDKKSLNQLDGGNGHFGCKHSEAWKEYISKKMTGRFISEEHRNKISRALFGIVRGPMSPEHKRKIGDSCKGRKATDDQIKRLKQSLIKHHKENPKKAFDVFTPDGVFVDRFPGSRYFIEKFGGSPSGVSAGLNGLLKTYKGYILKKVDKNAPSPASASTV